MIRITETITIDESEIQEQFIRASGPGGQHVNRAATAVQLRFDAAHSRSLPVAVRKRLIRLAGSRMTKDGVLIIQVGRFRSQERNRQEAMERLVELIQDAAKKPKVRRKTKPTRVSRERRLKNKRHRSAIKRLRRAPDEY
jgi:ribosome-associated protein